MTCWHLLQEKIQRPVAIIPIWVKKEIDKHVFCYYFEYLDYWPHVYCYTHNISANMSFGFLQVFHVDKG